MCIIVAKPEGVDIPRTETFNNCYQSNKDGIGFAYNKTGEKPVILKGFQNVKKLEKMLETMGVTKEHNLIVHFRFATHGKKDQGNCHPFPLSPSFDDMRLLHCSCECAIAHNGVFSGMPQSNNHSDTMKFIGGILASPEIIENLDKKSVKELIKGYCGYSSKLAFLRPEGLSLIGDFEKENDVFYSNSQFKKYIHNTWQDKDKDGREWCYHHKAYDNCEWCKIHKTYDTCEYDARQVKIKSWKDRFGDLHKDCNDNCGKLPILIGENKLDLRMRCQWCETTENVRYDYDVQATVCEACATLYVKGY